MGKGGGDSQPSKEGKFNKNGDSPRPLKRTKKVSPLSNATFLKVLTWLRLAKEEQIISMVKDEPCEERKMSYW